MKKVALFIFILSVQYILVAQNVLTVQKIKKGPGIDGIKSSSESWTNNWTQIDKRKSIDILSTRVAKFQMSYDDSCLYILVDVKDSTPSNNEVTIPNTYERDCIEVFISLDTLTGDGNYKEGTWQIRKQRQSTGNGLDGNSGKLGGGSSWSITPLTDPKSGFKSISLGDNNQYIQEWAIPWKVLSAQMPNGWTKKNFRFDISCADNINNTAGARALAFWNSNSDQQWHNTKYLGIVTLDSSSLRLPQTINFNDIPDQTIGNAAYELNIASSLRLPVTIVSSDTSIAKIKDNKLYAVGVGSCIVSALQAGNDSVKPAESVQKVVNVAKVPDFTSAKAIFRSPSISFYPNPSKDIVYFSNLPYEKGDAYIYSMQGKLMLKSCIVNNSINIKSLNSGAYFCKLLLGDEVHSLIIIKE